MNVLWVMILVFVYKDGSVKTDLQFPLKTEYNDEASCRENAALAAAAMQSRIGSDNAEVFFQCQSIDMDAAKKVLGAGGTDL
jgi:hypothetical protein